MTIVNNDKIVKTITLDAPISRVWKVLTDYKAFGEWFQVELNQPFKVDCESTGHMTYPGHEGVVWYAYVECLETERIFSFRWYDTDDPKAANTANAPALRVTFELNQTDGGTGLSITESGFSALDEPRRTELMQGNVEGWTIQVNNLVQYLSTPS